MLSRIALVDPPHVSRLCLLHQCLRIWLRAAYSTPLESASPGQLRSTKQEPAQLPPRQRRRREQRDSRICLRIAQRHATHADWDYAAGSEGRDKTARYRFLVEAHPYMCFETLELADGRSFNERSGRFAADTATGKLAPRKDIFGTWLLAPCEPKRAVHNR
jgi:hypothetical protein